MKQPYSHFENIHNTDAPRQIVPVVIDLINPKSVIDVGCGLGTFIKVFKESGINEIVGIDGSWCNKDLLFKNIKPSEFIEKDLLQPINLDKYFDLVVCLEVAEHLPPERADSFVADLVSLGDVILFSAAIPNQLGINHLNEQWISYWEEKFKSHNYVVHDILKSFFWDEESIFWWYKQNMVIITKSGYKFKTVLPIRYNFLNQVVHPELFRSRNEYFNDIIEGKSSLLFYIKLFIKAILYKLGLRR
jgi:2-polyprenyl-3-methyl-5-hydroxy-6-metoxy-1,4-benzoquinol methylase